MKKATVRTVVIDYRRDSSTLETSNLHEATGNWPIRSFISHVLHFRNSTHSRGVVFYIDGVESIWIGSGMPERCRTTTIYVSQLPHRRAVCYHVERRMKEQIGEVAWLQV